MGERYRPKAFKQQLRYDGKLIGCTDTVMAIGVDGSTLGGSTPKEVDIRLLSGEWPADPASPGINLSQCDKVARKLFIPFTNGTGYSWAKMVGYIDTGHAVLAQLWYSDIGGGNIGHAVYLWDRDGNEFLGVDPIKGVWQRFRASDVKAGMEHFAHVVGDGKLRYGVFRSTPLLA